VLMSASIGGGGGGEVGGCRCWLKCSGCSTLTLIASRREGGACDSAGGVRVWAAEWLLSNCEQTTGVKVDKGRGLDRRGTGSAVRQAGRRAGVGVPDGARKAGVAQEERQVKGCKQGRQAGLGLWWSRKQKQVSK
jgi:hypothetical protein